MTATVLYNEVMKGARPPSNSSTKNTLFAPPLRPFAIALGALFALVGILGAILSGIPGTVFLIAAAWLWSRSSPRFERWLLGLPVAGEMVARYRAGRGMPPRTKVIACLSIAVAVTLSTPRIPVLVGQVVWVLLGLAGVAYIVWQVPLDRGEAL